MNLNSKFGILLGISIGLFALALLLLMSNVNSSGLVVSLLPLGYAIAGGLGLIAAAIAPDAASNCRNDRGGREKEDVQS